MWKIKRIILSVLYICFASAAVVFSLFFLFTRFLLTEPPEQPDEFSPITTVTIPSEENKSDDTSEEIPHIVFDETKADEDLPVSSSAHSPMIAITFDDGPNANTARLLDCFEKYGGKCTFFAVGNMIEYFADDLKRAAENGHEIGSHGWDHSRLDLLTESEIAEQIDKTNRTIYDASGYNSTLLRPPYGYVNDLLKDTAAKAGIALIGWSVDPQDWKSRDADAVYESIMANVKEGCIILCHDLHATTVDAMEKLIPDLIEMGYRLVTVSELLTSDGSAIIPGEMYNHK